MKRLAHYSQYFLRSPAFIKELVGHTTIRKSDTVYDIGAGSGAISAVLARRAKAVVAVEYEPRMAGKLRENMAKYPNVTVVEGDFLKLPLPKGKYKVFANIPFHLSSPILRRLTEVETPPSHIYLIVQKQFAHKLLIGSDRFTGVLGAMVAPLFEARIRRPLRRTDFWPHPAVDTVLLELKHRPVPLLDPRVMPAYRQFVTDCFADPKVFAKTPRRKAGLPDGIKPSQLKLDQWLALFTESFEK